VGKRAKKENRKEMRALVDNANSGVALAVIRSLGKRGIDVTAASSTPLALSFYSKYCKHRVLYTSPKKNKNRYLKEMLKIVKKRNYDVLFTMSGYEMELISRYRERFTPFVKIPLADHETLEKASDKSQTLKIAMENDIPCPKTYFVKHTYEIEKIKDKVKYPIIIKPHKSSGAKGLTYIHSSNELKNAYTKVRAEYGACMIQEYIIGDEYFVSALFNKDSKPRRICVLRVLRKYPLCGGQATFVESVENPIVLKYGLKLLKIINYYGVAEIDFIIDSQDGKPKLLEINPRFWSSLQGAISAGVDFPYLLYRMAIDGDIKPSFNYKVGVKCRNLLFGDIHHLIDVMKSTQSKYTKLQTLLNFLKFHEDDAYYILSLDDPIPAIFKIMDSISQSIKGFRGERDGRVKDSK